MSNLLLYLDYYKRTILFVGGYVVVLISIPLTFMLVQSSQIFRSRASEVKTNINTSQKTTSEVPSSSPLEDLKALSESQIPQPGVQSATSPSSAVSFGPTLKFLINIEGRTANKQSTSKVFVGISSGIPTTKPTYLLTFSVEVPASGIFSDLSLAGLTTGSTYTAYIKGPGQIDKAVPFTMSSTETNLNNGQALILTSGDLNEDNQVSEVDQNLVTTLYSTTPNSSNWNPNADFNADGIVNQLDVNIVKANLGKIGDSGIWVSPAGATGGFWMYFPSVD